jgi:hypothetical protein
VKRKRNKLTYGVGLVGGFVDGSRASLGNLLASLLVILFLDGLADDLHEVLLESLLFEHKTVLVPDEVGNLRVPTILLHATLKETKDVLIVGILGELEFAAVVHELAEFFRVALAQLIDGHFELLLLNVVVLLVLGAPRKSLPGKTASQEVQQHVSNGL